MEQVVHDPELLSEMMDDLRAGDALYQSTNYWAFYERRFLPELRKFGLEDFRRRKNSVLSSFGATDLLLRPRVKLKPAFRGDWRIARMINALLFDRNPWLDLCVPDCPAESVTSWLHGYTRRKFDQIGLRLAECPTSYYGSPEDMTVIEGEPWSMAHLQSCAIFADAAQYIQFRPGSVVCELGTGMGRNVEVIAKLFQDSTFLMFDIPPQLYVAHQYLHKVFGTRVIGYREAKALQPDQPGTMDSIRGRIVILPTCRMPAWSGVKIDVFWNSASFQEMEPEVVTNYLKLVTGMRPESIYINALPGGNYWGALQPGRGGTRAPVTEACYVQALNSHYVMQHSYDTDYFFMPRRYRSYIFGAKQGG